MSRRMALESVVLLKNDGNFLPLDKAKIKSIAVIGPLADVGALGLVRRDAALYGDAAAGDEGEVGPNVKVNYAADDTPNGEADAIQAARQSEVAVVVVGNDPTCGPNMAHEWVNTPDGGRHASLHGRERRARGARPGERSIWSRSS